MIESNVSTRPPRIAINCDVESGERPRAFAYLWYVDFVVAHGGQPVIVPPSPGAESLLDLCDGVLLIGGDDYRAANVDGREPERFVAIEPRRESFDFTLVREAQRRDLPTLGICAGFQLQVLADGGSIHGDLGDGTLHRRARFQDPLPRHTLEWVGTDRIAALPAGTFEVNSHHHQGVADLPAGWEPVAMAPDGLVEAARGPGAFAFGVQWHPERSPEDPLNHAIGRAWLDAARERVRP